MVALHVKPKLQTTSYGSRYNWIMDKSVAQKLLKLNAEFYQTFATQFSDTRQRIQPGVQRYLDLIDGATRILDLGCGNGKLAYELNRRGFLGQYLGLDFSDGLLGVARSKMLNNPNYVFTQANIAVPDWQSSINYQPPGFDVILAFAVLHHLPSREIHLQICRAVRDLLSPNGIFIHSNWQFLKSKRLQKRIHPWKEIGLLDSDVEPRDYLLDWRSGGFGLRYVHHFSEQELNTLAEEASFRVVETSYSDGETGNLGLYQVWQIED
jgi:2-polyprenyl-3-methyl-5-hydroxy-6-metoxy-1,4-benzoquinol methylase